MERRVPRSHGVWRAEKALVGFRRSADRTERGPPRSRHLFGKSFVSSDELERVARTEPRANLTIRTRGQVPSRAREGLARSLTHVASFSPRPVLGMRASLTRSADRALPRPVVAKATIAVRGDPVRASATAATAGEAVNLLESRLRRKLRKLGERDLADRRAAPHVE
jgi:ribosome-associated translation inhibitor RaiA